MALNLKRQRFVEVYLATNSAKEAALAAGYAPGDAANSGYRLLKNADVAAAIEAARQASIARTAANATKAANLGDEVIAEIRRIAFADYSRLVTWEGGRILVVDSADVDPGTMAAISRVSESRQGKDVTLSIEMHSKLVALDKLARIAGLYDKREPNLDDNLPGIEDDDDPMVKSNGAETTAPPKV